MFVAEMQHGGLSGWAQNSQCVHATGTSLTAPFTRAGTVVSPWCHGPVALRDPKDGEWLLFHVGSGPGPSGAAAANSSGFMHHAPSPDGPWVPHAGPTPGGCNMPTAAFHPNGTLFAVCGNGDALTSAPSRHGAWTAQRALGKEKHWEDPTLWFDRRGNFHVIFHVYSLQPFAAGDWSVASGHMFSKDGVEWHRSSAQPFNGSVDFTDGTTRNYATRERPQLVFTDRGRHTPMALISSVSSQPIGHVCDTCTQHACSQCKVTPGRDWTFTIVQPLRV